jgi:hypothetical protein
MAKTYTSQDNYDRGEQKAITKKSRAWKLDKVEGALVDAIKRKRNRHDSGHIGWAKMGMRQLEKETRYEERALRGAIDRLSNRGHSTDPDRRLLETEMKGEASGKSNSYRLHDVDGGFREPPKRKRAPNKPKESVLAAPQTTPTSSS